MYLEIIKLGAKINYIVLYWKVTPALVPAPSGILGNEAADIENKKGFQK